MVVELGMQTVREEHRLWVFENRVLRKMLGPKWDEVVRWRRMHNKEVCALYSSPNIIWLIKSRRMRWAQHVTYMGERRDVYRVLVGKPEAKRQLGRLRHRLENIKINLQEIEWVGCWGMDWINVA
jgi:hypothetical protein